MSHKNNVASDENNTSGEILTEEIICNGLSELGKSVNGLSFVFINLDISNKNLSNIACLSKYIHLRNINASNNNLTTLLPAFNNLHCLTVINISFNKIKNLLEFGSNGLIEVNYSHNRIESLSNLDSFIFLKKLDISYNNLRSLEGISALKNLTELNCRHNYIRVLSRDLSLLPLQKLYLDFNNLDNYGEIPHKELVELGLSNNKIYSLENFRSKYPRLTSLDLSSNQITNVIQLLHLSGLAMLCNVSIYNNAFDIKYSEAEGSETNSSTQQKESRGYKWHALYMCRRLTCLDGEKISAEDKVKACNIFGNDFEERQVIIDKYFSK